MGWSSIKGGQKAFEHELTAGSSRLARRHDCKECHKGSARSRVRVFMGHRFRGCGRMPAKDQPKSSCARTGWPCERCHGVSVWKVGQAGVGSFNHDDRKDAAMPLLGRQKDVACSKCHVKNV